MNQAPSCRWLGDPQPGGGKAASKTETGSRKPFTFQNASVGMPIISTNCLAREDNDITFRANDGYVLHNPTGERTPFVARDGVYFMQMRVPRSLLGDQVPGVPRHG